MTFKQLVKESYPEFVCDKKFSGGVRGCPHDYGYEEVRIDDCNHHCRECWDREISASTPVSAIKDSGDRTKFETGAVRDMRAGKGRFDLVPLEVVSQYWDFIEQLDRVLLHLERFQETKYVDVQHLLLALKAFCINAYNDCAPTMFLEVAKHFEEGAVKYGENNWQKGIPPHVYIDSALRHYMKWLRKDTDEPHDRAFVWNIMCCIWEVEFHKEVTE